jgi:hypothetical protein
MDNNLDMNLVINELIAQVNALTLETILSRAKIKQLEAEISNQPAAPNAQPKGRQKAAESSDF